jgi:hypothetical protein
VRRSFVFAVASLLLALGSFSVGEVAEALSKRAPAKPRVECLIKGGQTYRVKPSYCPIYEHGSSATTILTSMKWSDWGKRRTRGRGVIKFFDHPEYAGRVIVGLSRLRRGGCLSGRFYTDAHVHVVSGEAKGNVFDLRLAAGCPA